MNNTFISKKFFDQGVSCRQYGLHKSSFLLHSVQNISFIVVIAISIKTTMASYCCKNYLWSMVQSTVNSMIVTIYIISVMLLTVDWVIISKVGNVDLLFSRDDIAPFTHHHFHHYCCASIAVVSFFTDLQLLSCGNSTPCISNCP